ncbi:MAG: deoxyhypusine synthase [archaeon]
MKIVEHARISPRMKASGLVHQLAGCRVLAAGKLGEAASIVTEMFSSQEYTNFLSIAGPMVPGGLRIVIGDLVERGFIDAIITTGANIVHDIVEALGYHHFVGTFSANDAQLKKRRFGRIGDIYVEQAAFKALEKFSFNILDNLSEDRRQRISLGDLLEAVASRLSDPDSILVKCRKMNVPIFSPGFLDSMMGLNLWTYSQTKRLVIDELQDMSRLINLGFDADKSGAIILGGGVPKHHTLIANIFRDGVDSAVQITMDRPEPGGLSGASLEEAISWSKVRERARYVSVISDATICFPLIVAAVLDKVSTRRKKKRNR